MLAGHNFYSCHKNSVPGCGKKHTKFIHIDNDKVQVSDSSSTSVSNCNDDNQVNGNSYINVRDVCLSASGTSHSE